MKLKKILIYYSQWLIPSSTALYIYLHEYNGVNMLVAYVVGSVVAGTMFYPINKYIFRNGEHL